MHPVIQQKQHILWFILKKTSSPQFVLLWHPEASVQIWPIPHVLQDLPSRIFRTAGASFAWGLL